MIKRLFLLCWIAVIIFPLNYLENNSAVMRAISHQVFGTELAHIIGHTILFAGLVMVTGWAFKLELNLVNTLFLASLVVALGGMQEIFQLVVKNRPPGIPEFFDLAVDGFGGLIGWMLYYSIRYLFVNREMRLEQNNQLDYSLWSW